MVLGFGEIMFPALPPPDRATSNDSLEKPIRLPTSKAMGATISTATGINTPTAVITIEATAKASRAQRSPKVLTIARANVSAAPDSIITPASIPAASTRSTVPMTLWDPLIRISMVWTRLAPPSRAPITAPSSSEYTGFSFLRIKIMATAKPINAAHQDKTGLAIKFPS